MKNARVRVAPGSAFGAAGDPYSDSFLRIRFPQAPERLRIGLERLEKAVARTS